ncbi:hypothetical protein B0A52_09466 [Exophiala mesophila]|uniref:4-coumarate-CoA ligase n=1 Tax=Exophiala mesophila TaxID=212818 RepID=A0A438MUP4_EXOME|nr:hypothetical protein B0A52_09466 [Exophiala mesophila]
MPPTIYRSRFPDFEPIDLDVVTYVFSNPQNTPENRPLYIDAVTKATRTFGEVKKKTKSLSHGLRKLGVKPKDVVAFISPNSIDYAIICYAVLGAGATISPASVAYTPLELQGQLETSEAKVVIAHSSVIDVVEKAVKFDKTIQILQADGDVDKHGQPTAESLASTCPATELISISPDEAGDRVAFMCFSSGTTGRAKGVMTTHRNMVSNLQQWMVHFLEKMDNDSKLVTFLPFSHIYGLTSHICVNVFLGTSLVVLPRFDLPLYLECLHKYRPEWVFVVPPIMLLLAKHPLVEKYDLSSLRRFMSAAAPLSPELRQDVEDRFKKLYGTTVYGLQAWGLTETSPLATLVPSSRPDKRNTVGNITPGMEFRVVDPDTSEDVDVAADGSTSKAGELWCRGPNVTKGYFRNAEATKEGFAQDPQGNSWFRTGDIGTIDNEGFVTIVDRIKEMIKYKGMQVIPSELEGKLLAHPDVEDACVVGQWVEEQATELPHGFVVIKQSAKPRGEEAIVTEIHAWLNPQIANHKRLRGGITIIDAVPKSTSGKILRRQLKETLNVKRQKQGSKL